MLLQEKFLESASSINGGQNGIKSTSRIRNHLPLKLSRRRHGRHHGSTVQFHLPKPSTTVRNLGIIDFFQTLAGAGYGRASTLSSWSDDQLNNRAVFQSTCAPHAQ
jgi:hypothetical protein